MIEQLATAIEKSTYVINASFFDEDNISVVPNSVSWKLTDINGNVINNRSNESETPAASVDIVLSNNDLVASNGKLVLTIWGTYNSSLGSNLPYKKEVKFDVENLVAF